MVGDLDVVDEPVKHRRVLGHHWHHCCVRQVHDQRSPGRRNRKARVAINHHQSRAQRSGPCAARQSCTSCPPWHPILCRLCLDHPGGVETPLQPQSVEAAPPLDGWRPALAIAGIPRWRDSGWCVPCRLDVTESHDAWPMAGRAGQRAGPDPAAYVWAPRARGRCHTTGSSSTPAIRSRCGMPAHRPKLTLSLIACSGGHSRGHSTRPYCSQPDHTQRNVRPT